MSLRMLAVLTSAALAVPLAGGLAQEGWQTDLANEILLMEDCEVSFLTQVIERTVDGRQVVMAKAHCVDGRTFDALREDTFAAFAFTICQPEEAPASC